MYREEYRKPDGRRLWLYGRSPVAARGPIPSPSPVRAALDTHLRRHPILQEWVIYASHRQDRTFLPTAERDPLAPTTDPEHPTELPTGDYDVAVFENRFPSLVPDPAAPPRVEGAETGAAVGACEVVVFSQEPDCSLAKLPVDHITLILDVWADRTCELQRAGMAYVLPFENRGVEMGVTLLHPHGQIYAYGFVPARQARASQSLAAHHERTGRDLVTDLAGAERERQVQGSFPPRAKLLPLRRRSPAFLMRSGSRRPVTRPTLRA